MSRYQGVTGGGRVGGLGPQPLYFEVPDEPRHANAQQRERRGFVDLLRVMSEPDMRTKVPVQHRYPLVEVHRLNSNVRHLTP